MKLKKEYVAPNLTVVSFKVERGYATSVQEMADQINWVIQQDAEMYYADEQEAMETERTLDAGYWNSGDAGTWF